MVLSKTELLKGEALLRSICGVRLTSVDFVLNYLILGFNMKGALTTLVWPEVVDGEKVLLFGMDGYRDRLCELICQIIRDVKVNEDETIIILLENQTQLLIKLKSRDAARDRAIFTAPKHHLFVW